MRIERFQIAERFRGLPRSGNGGYVCGRIARHPGDVVSARLMAPPPLGSDLRLESTSQEACFHHGEMLIGEAKAARLEMPAPISPSHEQAQRFCGPPLTAEDTCRVALMHGIIKIIYGI